jgi:hypothetical protein
VLAYVYLEDGLAGAPQPEAESLNMRTAILDGAASLVN